MQVGYQFLIYDVVEMDMVFWMGWSLQRGFLHLARSCLFCQCPVGNKMFIDVIISL